MTHDGVRELLALAAAGVLDAAGEHAVQTHVRECAACAAELETLRQIGEEMAALPVTPAPQDLLLRTQMLLATEIELQTRRYENSIALAVGALFSWIVTLAGLIVCGWVVGGSAAIWWGASSALTLTCGGVAALLLARRHAAQRRIYESL